MLIHCDDFWRGDEYLLLDAILTSSCFGDAGMVSYGRKEFRRYAAKFYPNVLVPDSPLPREGKRIVLKMYSVDDDEIMERVLASYGVRQAGSSDLATTQPARGWVRMKEFSVPDVVLPAMTLLCKGDVKPSRRVVADCAYRKWLSRKTHGDDVSDWLCAEAEMFERMESVVKELA